MALVLFTVCAAACVSQKIGVESLDERGTIGEAAGFRGIIRVRVVMEQGTITEIILVESHEDRAVGGAAIEELTDLVLLYNTTELDLIAGASETSKGFLAAVENATLNP